MRNLTSAEIGKFASRKGVRRIAVENFLMTVTASGNAQFAFENLAMDARLYKWNAATYKAILDGIILASK